MKILKWIASNKIIVIAPLLTLVVATVFVYASNRNEGSTAGLEATQNVQASTNTRSIETAALTRTSDPAAASDQNANTAKVVLKVDGMSCSSCISNIKSSLAGFEGIQDIIVNISGGFAEVYYDGQTVADVKPFEAAITAAGYPARISRILTAEQLKDEEAIAAQRAEFYIASVGGWDISRADYDTELAIVQKRYQAAYGPNVFSDEQGKKVLDSLKTQVASRLINEGIQMQEVQRVGYQVDPKSYAEEFNNFITQKNISLEEFKTSLANSEYPFDYFIKKFENRILLRRYIESQVIQAGSGDYERQQQYLAWFDNARQLSKVVVYDKELKRLSQEQSTGGGCGSTCSR